MVETMRAAVVSRYGPPSVARVQDVPRPRVRDGDVLVRVRSAAVTTGDARIRAARFPTGMAVAGRLALGLRGPRRAILGGTFSGEVTEVGSGVTGIRPGDAVCGMNGVRMGAHAQYVAVASGRVAPKPDNVTHDQAAGALFGGTTALYFLRDKAGLSAGQTVLINGASGAIGTNAIQLAAADGAKVTAVCSAANADLVTGLGAVNAIDYRVTDPAELSERFDVVLDTVGTLTVTTGRRLLAPGGALLLAAAGLPDMVRARGNVHAGTSKERPEVFRELLDRVVSGSLEVVIDGVFPLDEIATAYARVDSGRKVGNVLIHP